MEKTMVPRTIHTGIIRYFGWLVGIAILAGGQVHAATTGVVINEFMASNSSTITDGNGIYSDWIELYNGSGAPVDLSGWYLTDDPNDLTKWPFPSGVTLPNGDYFLLFASGQTVYPYLDAGEHYHTNFKLKNEGEFLALVQNDGVTIAHEYAPQYPAQTADVSYGLNSATVSETALISSGASARYLVPSDGSLGTTWITNSFDDSAWDTGNTGIGYETSPADYAGLIQTDVLSLIYNLHSSIYIRIPVSIDDLAAIDTLTLRMKYDDGFVAYLNGVEVARAHVNVPDGVIPDYDDFGTNHNDWEAVVFQDFDISDHIGLLQTGSNNVLAIHGLNSTLGSSDLLILPDLTAGVLIPFDPPVPMYFLEPTPGARNSVGSPGSDWNLPLFSRPGGTFTESFSLVLLANDPNAVIRYTLDGSLPNVSSLLYTAAIPMSVTTRVRAQVYLSGLPAGEVASQSYLALDASVQDFTSNLPLVVIDTFGTALNETTFQNASTAFINVGDTGRTAISDPVDFTGRIGIRIRGNSAPYMFEKKHYAVETWDEQNNDKSVSLLGFPSESDWILYGAYHDKTMMRNQLSYLWSNRMGRYAPRTKFVEVFINTDGSGKISSSHYNGVYVFMEKIKRDKNRVNIQKLEPTDNSEPEISGGYIIKRDWEGANFTTSLGVPLLYNEPEDTDITNPQKAWIQNYYNTFETALQSPNFTDPVNGYAKYIDVDSFINGHWLVELTRNLDGFRASFYMHKDRGGKLKTGPLWDFDVALGNAYWESRPDYLPEGWRQLYTGGFDETQWYPRLFEDPEFTIKWNDRWVELHKNLWSADVLMADIDESASLLDEAQVRQFQRWPILGTYVNFNPPGWAERDTYQKEVDWLKDWLQTRVNWIDSQIIHPLFNQEGGRVYNGFVLTMSKPVGAAGDIFYTLDGSDPRLTGGSIAAGAILYSSTGPLTLTSAAHIKARILNGTEWSALNEEQFSIGPMVLINEFMASNSSTIVDPDEPNEFPDWVELYNPSPFTVDLSGMYLTDDLTNPTKWQFPAGVSIGSGGHRIFWIDDDGTQGPTHTNFKLNIDGEQIGLFDTDGETLIDRKYFGRQTTDVSCGRTVDGGPDWQFLTCPTPGWSNFIPSNLDLNGDCAINLEDFTNLNSHWLENNMPTNTVVWDYATEFSVYQGNPNGVWTYGLYDGPDFSSANFVLYNSTAPILTLDPWALNGNRDNYGSCQKNMDELNPLDPGWPNGMYWEPGQTSLMTPASYVNWRPTARFTAPAASEYQVDARFWSGTVNGDPTNVYVLVNRAVVHSEQISGYYSEPDSSSSYSDLLPLQAGDTVDFCVGAVTGQGLAYDGGFHIVQFDATVSAPAFCGGPGFDYLPGDINTDCVVDMNDFMIFASQWLGAH